MQNILRIFSFFLTATLGLGLTLSSFAGTIPVVQNSTSTSSSPTNNLSKFSIRLQENDDISRLSARNFSEFYNRISGSQRFEGGDISAQNAALSAKARTLFKAISGWYDDVRQPKIEQLTAAQLNTAITAFNDFTNQYAINQFGDDSPQNISKAVSLLDSLSIRRGNDGSSYSSLKRGLIQLANTFIKKDSSLILVKE